MNTFPHVCQDTDAADTKYFLFGAFRVSVGGLGLGLGLGLGVSMGV
jgi:hypothetical protein